MNKQTWWVIAILVIAIAAVAYLVHRPALPSAGRGRGRFGNEQPVAVRAAPATTSSMDVVLDAMGTVTANNTAVVHSRVDGLLQSISYKEGGQVKAGDLLATIDPRPFDAALAQAQGQLQHDQALLAAARSDLDRYQGLLAQDSIARQQVDDQRALVNQYGGSVLADRGNVANARLQRQFTRVTAPISGRAGLRQVDVGNIVHAADANGLVVITQTEPINVLFAVPAEQAPEINRRWKSGQDLMVHVYGRDGTTRLARGRLESVDNEIDASTGTIKLKASFPNTDEELLPNQFVNVKLTLDTLEDQVLIPGAAVQHGTQGTFVYVLGADSTVAIRNITTGVTNEGSVAVTQGLKSGERVVTQGLDKLRDGAKVQAAVDAPPPATRHRNHNGWANRRGGERGQRPPGGSAPGPAPTRP